MTRNKNLIQFIQVVFGISFGGTGILLLSRNVSSSIANSILGIVLLGIGIGTIYLSQQNG